MLQHVFFLAAIHVIFRCFQKSLLLDKCPPVDQLDKERALHACNTRAELFGRRF